MPYKFIKIIDGEEKLFELESLEGADLTGITFSTLELNGINLDAVDYNGCFNFNGTINLSGINIDGGASFIAANLIGANLEKATLNKQKGYD